MIVERREVQEKQASTTPNNEDNISTKSSTQQSQSSILNTLEISTNNINKTHFKILVMIIHMNHLNIENPQQMKYKTIYIFH